MIDPVDVKRSYRFEQGFTFELNLWGDSDELRQAFVDKRDAELVTDRAARRRFWGWGVDGAGPDRRAAGEDGRDDRGAFRGRAACTDRSADDRRARPPRRRASRRPTPSQPSAPTIPRSAPATHTASRSATCGVRCTATSRNRPMSSPIPRDRGRRRRAARLVQRSRESRRSRTAADRRWSAVSSATSTTTYHGARQHRPARARSGARDRPRVARGAYPGRRVRTRARGPTATARPDACGTSRSRSSSRRSAAGSRPGRAGTTRRLHTHIDDFVESIRAVTPRGVWESRRLPGSGAGPSPDRALLGSEGTLGVITEAWMRLQDRPTFRASATARFSTFSARRRRRARRSRRAASTPRTAACSTRSKRSSPAPTTRATRSCCSRSSRPTIRSTPWIGRAVECVRDHGARVDDDSVVIRSEEGTGAREGAAGSWRNAFVRAPYTRDAIVALGVISETFETACTWDRFDALYDAVSTAVLDTAEAAGASPAVMTCRFTHVYPDGPAPYFTVLALGQEGEQLAAVGGDQGRGGRRARSARAARSRTTTRSAATTAAGTTGSDPSRSRPRSRPPSARSTRRGSSTPGC